MTAALKQTWNPQTTRPTNAVQLYALGEPDGTTVKLGRTKSLNIRKKQHEERGPNNVEMKMLFCWWGTVSDEHTIKGYFKSLRLPGRAEWFKRDDRMSEWLTFMMKQPFVARNVMDLDLLSMVDSSQWLPDGEHSLLAERLRQQPVLFSALPKQTKDGHLDPWSDLEPDAIGEGDFYSPVDLVDAARAALGGTIDLDPASCRVANGRVKAERFYSVKEDGLQLPWYGNIWVNPPFPWEPWVEKLIAELARGRVDNIIALCTTRVTTAKYFHPMVSKADAVLKMMGRIQFWGPKAGAPDEGHEVYYFGKDTQTFVREFRKYGTVFVPYRPRD